MKKVAINIENVSKQYILGAIGGTTLREELNRISQRLFSGDDASRLNFSNKKFLALNDVSLRINQGESIGIIGHNGAGKSTLLKLLCRVTAPSKGTIGINGRIASMLEVGTGFHGELTGRENIYLNGAILGMSKKEVDSKLEEIIDFSECREFIDTPVKRYSSGMYVKLAFSVAAHLDAEILIMDEVLAVGDMAFQKKCLSKMNEAVLKEGRTVLYVSHNMSTIRQLCSRCVVLDKGRIIYDGAVEEAIDIYMGITGELSNSYLFTEEYHQHKTKGKFRINSLNLLDTDSMRFAHNSSLRVFLNCTSNTFRGKVLIRYEIKYQDGTDVGAMVSSSSSIFELNESKNVLIQMKTDHFSPGRYRADIVAYTNDQFGNEEYLDGVYPGFVFEIEDYSNDEKPIIWLHQYWGHVRFDDLIIE